MAGGRAATLLSGRLSQFDNLQLATVAYYFVAVAGLTVLTGLNGQISLGHGALMAVGAYTTAKLLGEDGTGPPLAAVLVARDAWPAPSPGVLAGAAAARLRGPYLAGATLALAVGLPAIAQRFPDFLGASNGLTVFAADAARRARRDVPARALAGVHRLPGRAARPTSCSPTWCAAGSGATSGPSATTRSPRELAGLHVARTQVLAFVVSAACAGPGRRAARRRHVARRARRVPARAVGRAAHRRDPRRARAAWPARSGAPPRWSLIPTWADDASQALVAVDQRAGNLALAVYGAVLIGVMLAAPRGSRARCTRRPACALRNDPRGAVP